MTAISDWIVEISGNRVSDRAQPIVGQVARCVAAWQQVLSGLTGGTVTSVGLSMPAEFSVTGSPVTTTGTLTASWAAQPANSVLAGPVSGITGTPVFRSLVPNDIPGLSASYLPIAGGTMTGPIVNPNGSVNAPQIAFSAGQSGMFFDAAVSGVAFSVSASEIAWFTSGGLVLQRPGGSGVVFSQQGESTVSLFVGRYSTDPNGSQITQRKARGTIAAPAVVATNDILGQQISSGYDGVSTFQVATNIQTRVIDTTPSPTAMGGRIVFNTTPIGSVTAGEVMRLDSAGGLQMFGANPAIDANRLLRNRVFTVATLPTFVEGAQASISDATLTMLTGLGLAPVGGGANHVPVIADNVGWKIV